MRPTTLVLAVAVATLVASGPSPAAVAAGRERLPELYRSSYAAEAKGDIAGALAALDPVPPEGAADYVYALRRGWLLHLLGRDEESVTSYRAAIERAPEAVEPRLGALLPLMALRRWKEAEARAGEVLVRAPHDATALGKLAYIHYTQGRYAKAEAAYRQVVADYPGNVEMRAGLGWSLLQQARPAEAKTEFERVLLVAPDYTIAKEGLAACR